MSRGAAGAAEGGGSSLDYATKLVRDIPAGWVLGLYLDAGEASGTFQYRARPGRCSTPGPALDPDRSRSEAESRARVHVRRFMAANRLDRLASLTYASDGLRDERVLRGHVRHFIKRLRADLGGDPLAYLWVPEWCPGGHGLHVHVAFGRYIPQAMILESWGRGIVDIRRRTKGGEQGSLASARRAAGYLSKYVAKSFDAPHVPGLHRYEVAQGFKPRVVRVVATSADQAIALASERMGRAPSGMWSSEGVGDWRGPPAVTANWDD